LKLVVTGGSGKLARYLVPSLAVDHEVVLYDKQSPEQDKFRLSWIRGEIIDVTKLREAFKGADAVIHLAALRSCYNYLPVKVMETNALGTFCVLEAANSQGVKKVVFSSSDAVLGIAQSKTDLAPEYLPVDENHPLKPQDPYGVSKMLGEEMCRCYAEGYGISIIALRFSNILCPGDESKYLHDAQDPSLRHKSLWAWVHVEDAIGAILCAFMSDIQGFGIFHIAADDVCLVNPDVPRLLATYFPRTQAKKTLSRKESLVNCRRAKRMLSFRPRRSFDQILTTGHPEQA
jgi:nucleoside-diphosphate-sugar epimerase